ncbi:hypothetical protein Gohar_024710 [Gossypium harknessii]|uniref:Uncharacterized protein n=1 Tax=Gossypium harknessii TaxID=34285 RepID=A0A7J9HGX5_9ROSI|nr:hypothetical protein [Gossypium harknessii]
MLVVACLQFGGNGNEGGEDGEVVGSKCSEGEGEGESDDVAVNEGGESDGGGEKGVKDKKAMQKVREVEGKTSGKCKETVLDETESESSKQQFEAKVSEEVDGEGLNYSVGREKDGDKTEYLDSDDHGSILRSEDDDNTDVGRRRTRFSTYNPNSTSPYFCTRMLFKDAQLLC